MLDPHHERRRRWPDHVVKAEGGRTAVELELSPKNAVAVTPCCDELRTRLGICD